MCRTPSTKKNHTVFGRGFRSVYYDGGTCVPQSYCCGCLLQSQVDAEHYDECMIIYGRRNPSSFGWQRYEIPIRFGFTKAAAGPIFPLEGNSYASPDQLREHSIHVFQSVVVVYFCFLLFYCQKHNVFTIVRFGLFSKYSTLERDTLLISVGEEKCRSEFDPSSFYLQAPINHLVMCDNLAPSYYTRKEKETQVDNSIWN